MTAASVLKREKLGSRFRLRLLYPRCQDEGNVRDVSSLREVGEAAVDVDELVKALGGHCTSMGAVVIPRLSTRPAWWIPDGKGPPTRALTSSMTQS